MFVVAIARLGPSREDQVQRLAKDLDATVLETRMLLARGFPVAVLRTAEKDRAMAVLARLRAQHHQAVAFDTNSVIYRDSMIRPRALVFEPDGLRGETAELCYGAMRALILGSQPTRSETTYTTKQRKVALVRAVVTGGAQTTKLVKKVNHLIAEDRERILFIYPRTNTTPWCLEEHGIRYQCLGSEMTTNHMENFRLVVSRVRSLAQSAVYDESLVQFAGASHDKLGQQAIDEQAHLIALCAAKGFLARP